MLATVFAVAFVCRAAVFIPAIADPVRSLSPPDSPEYVTIAQNVAAGRGFSEAASPPYRPDVRRTPVYPSLLAGVFLTGGGLRLAAFVGIVESAATVAVSASIAAALFGAGAGLFCGLLLAVDAISVSYSGLILTEASFTLLLVAGVFALLRRPQSTAATAVGAALLGAATLCRPAGILLGPASLPVGAWRGGGRRSIARRYVLVNVIFVAVALLWVARNAVVAGAPTLSSIASVNLYFHRAAAVEARVEGKDVDDVRASWEKQFESMAGRWTEPEKLEWMTRHAKEVIAQHPFIYVLTTVDGMALMLESDADELCRVLGLAEGTAAFRAAAVASALQLSLLYAAAIGGLAAALRDPQRRLAALIPLTFIAYFVLVGGPEAYSRFRVPAMPFIAILGGAGVDALVKAIRGRVLS
jgi:4-amino-4-deoxy-L-arabinose transferase-like glycosyltransferase